MPRANLDKRKILEAAGALANEISIRKLNLKQLAQKLNIQPPSLYNHVQSLDHLRYDLMVYGWEEAGKRIADALIGISGDEAIRRACHVFYYYAEENPGIFEAMAYYNWGEDRPRDGVPDRLTDILYKLCRSRDIPEEEAVHVLRLFRSYLEGFALLAHHGAFPQGEARESFRYGVEFLIAGIRRLEAGQPA